MALLIATVSNVANCQTPPDKPSIKADGSRDSRQSIRVLSYNIHHGQGIDGRLDLERIARVIRSVSPDIVALQEVDVQVKRSQSVDQARELAELCDMRFVFGGNIDLQGGKYGNAVLTKGMIETSTNIALPNVDDGEQRGLLDVRIRLNEQKIRVLATHFDNRPDSRERLASIEIANQLALADKETPTLLVGDLNAEFESEVLQHAKQVWSITNPTRMPTIPVTKPKRQIDFVLTHPTGRWQVRDTQVLDESQASDHRPLLAILGL